jgi:hypothetical protein
VAERLEERYHIMQTFYESRKEKIAQFLADDMAYAIQDLMNGKPIAPNRSSTFTNQYHGISEKYSISSLSYGADQRIEAEFRSFIFSNEMQKMSLQAAGAPISAAALKGVNKRKKHPYAQANKARPAFVDTGLYVASMRAWTQR